MCRTTAVFVAAALTVGAVADGRGGDPVGAAIGRAGHAGPGRVVG